MVSALRRVPAGLLLISLMISFPQASRAQDDAAEKAAAPAATDTPADPPADDKAAPAAKVVSPLVIEPQTPEELFDATVLMMEIARPDVAKLYLSKFMESDPQDELLLKLRAKYGPAVFLKLSNIEDLQPQSIELLNRNNAAFTRFARDPARIGALLKDLTQGNSSQRAVAQVQMRTAGVHVVPALISALGNPTYADSYTVLVETLASIKAEAVPPLEAALNSPNPRTRQGAMLALGQIRDVRTIPYLLRFAGQTENSEDKSIASKAIAAILRVPSIPNSQTSNVATRLQQQAKDHALGKVDYDVGPDKQVNIWEWNDQTGTVQDRRVPPVQKSLHEGLSFAQAALQVAPERPDVQATYLDLLLAQEVAYVGVGRPLPVGHTTMHDLAESLGPDIVARSLGEALDLGLRNSAVAALQILAKIGTVQQVRTVNGKQAALQRALNSPSRRVQFAAVETILSLDPTSRYPGSERVVSILGRALTQAESSQPRGLVLDSAIERGQTLAGFLRELGYEPTFLRTGKDGFKLASQGQEIDLVLIDANIQRWALSETLANFKADPRTMDLPMVIYGSSQNERNVRVLVRQFPNVIFIQEPTATEDLRLQIERFMTSQQEGALTPEERSAKALQAAQLLSFVSRGQRQNLYNLTHIEPQLVAAAENPQLSEALLPVVGALPTAAAQTRLADLSLETTATEQVRVTALNQLTRHVRLHGLLISKAQVDLLHQTWQQSTNGPISAELSALVGVLRPNDTLVGERLRGAVINQAPVPAPPPEPAKQ